MKKTHTQSHQAEHQAASALNRRSFLAQSTGYVTLPLLLSGLPVHAFDGPALHDLFNLEEESDRVLVLVQLSGGNDGLNTVIPLDQYADYVAIRENIAIAENKVLPLRSGMGLHPAMTGAQELWRNNHLAVVQAVGYPNPNQSHFRSNDIWMSGSASNVVDSTGWMGRYLNTLHPDYPNGYPNSKNPHPIAIQMSATVGMSLVGIDHQSMGIALQDPEYFYRLVNGSSTETTELPQAVAARNRVQYVRDIQAQSTQYSQVIKDAASKAKNTVEYPLINRLAQQLAIVARMIAGGLNTRVYVVTLGGFDTHAGQVTSGETDKGLHATLLGYVSEALSLFQQDLQQLGAADRVLTMTFSEFGRRVASNVSDGTDHGSAAPMFVMGTNVEHGERGANPSVTDIENGNLRMQFDFRAVYSSVLQQWFGAKPEVVQQILSGTFASIPIVRSDQTSVLDSQSTIFQHMRCFPNPVPAGSPTTIEFMLRVESHVTISIFDTLGFFVGNVLNSQCAAGKHTLTYETSGLPSGTYHIQLRVAAETHASHFVIVR
jgi:uncharacterized protein (DUF1501 family)